MQAFAFSCGSVSHKLTYLFWPHGHVGLPSVYPTDINGRFFDVTGVPIDPASPHVSVYRVGSAYPDSNWLGSIQVLEAAPAIEGIPPGFAGGNFDDGTYVAMRGQTDPSKQCGFGHGARIDMGISHRKSTEKATALTCRFKSDYGYFGFGGVDGQSPRKFKVRVNERRKVILEAKTTGVPRLRYDTSRCKRVALPR